MIREEERQLRQAKRVKLTPEPSAAIETPEEQHVNADSAFEDLPFAERRAALRLVQMAQGEAALNSDRVLNLIQTLTVGLGSSLICNQTTC